VDRRHGTPAVHPVPGAFIVTSPNLFAAPLATTHVFLTDAWRAALDRLADAPGLREPVLLVTGPPGTGTSTLVTAAIARWDARAEVARVASPALSRADLVEELAVRFGATTTAGTRPQLLAALATAFAALATAARVPVVAIDDAHLLPDEALDELRLLADAEARAGRPLELLLAGTPALEARLASADHAALQQRIGVHVRLQPFSSAETRQYLNHRVRVAGGDGPRLFPRRACTAIHARSGGAVRAINRIAGESLRRARAGGESAVSPELVDAATAALELDAGAAGAAAVAPVPPPARTKRERAVAAPAEAPQPAHRATRAETPAPASPVTGDAPAAAAHTAEAADAPVATAEAHVATAEAPASPPAAHETRAKDWVARFVGNQGPPRIGAALVAPVFDDSHEPLSAATDELPAGTAPRKPLKLIVLDDLPDDVPQLGSRAALPPVRHRRADHGRTLAIACTAAVVCAAGAYVTLDRMHALPWRWQTIVAALTPADTAPPAAAPVTTAAATPVEATDETPVPPPQAAPMTLAATSGSSAPIVTPVEPAPEPADVRTGLPAADEAPPADDVAPAPRSQRLGLEVGTYLDADRAHLECERLAAESGLRAWVVTSREYGATSYRVVLGVFRTEDRAQSSATTLLERGLVSEARVVPLPPRRSRR